VGERYEIGKDDRKFHHNLSWKARAARFDVVCRDFGLTGGTVGWARTTDLLFHRQAL
jgi:hypothetical protein